MKDLGTDFWIGLITLLFMILFLFLYLEDYEKRQILGEEIQKETENRVTENNTVENNTVKDNTAKDNTAKDNTAKDNTAKDNTAKDNTAKDNTAKDNTVKDNTVKDNTVEDNTVEGNTAEDNIVEGNTVKDNIVKENAMKQNTAKVSVTEAGGEERNKTQDRQNIRVLIKNDDMQGVYHEHLDITGTSEYYAATEIDSTVRNNPMPGKDCTIYAAEEILHISSCATLYVWLKEPEGELVIKNLKRGEAAPSYQGMLEIHGEEQGLVVVNELPLEQYLPAVLSSEMSDNFPEEALLAQAVVARTYALQQIESGQTGKYNTNLDDSDSYQVYNNYHKSDRTEAAIAQTDGMILISEGKPAAVFYYSTSCGVKKEDNFQIEAAFDAFIRTIRSTDEESEEPWYRWSVEITAEQIEENLRGLGFMDVTGLKYIEVTKRNKNGQADQLTVYDANGSITICGEYEIRQCLCPGAETITRQDKSKAGSLRLLPSAWFVISPYVQRTVEIDQTGTGETGFDRTEIDKAGIGETEIDMAGIERTDSTKIRLLGGGFGHGVGMSQNGAKHMAEQGSSWKEILAYYYPNAAIENFKQDD